MASGAGAIQILQKSLEAARKDLTSTNDAIKRLTGRDPTAKPVPRTSNPERRISSTGRDTERRITAPIRIERRFSGHGRESERRISGPAGAARNDGGRMRAWTAGDAAEGPSAKRRDLTGSRSRLAGRLGPPAGRLGPPGGGDGGPGSRRGEERERGARPRVGMESRWREGKHQNSDGEDNEERDPVKPSLQSSVVATKVPPRPNADPNEDQKSKNRNRRMFGFLMGTLQKFKDSEDVAKQSDKERRRAEIEEKLDQQRELEKETAMQARKDLFQELKSKKTKIARISYQMTTIQMYEEWNTHDRQLLGYIKTKATPSIFYLPTEHTQKTKQLLEETKSAIEAKISERQKEVESFLSEGGEGETDKKEDSFAELDGDDLGEVEDKGRGRREGSDSNDGSDKEP